jgi:hypothetical protein
MLKPALFVFCLVCTIAVQAQPKVYFDFVSHNEENTIWNGIPYYTANRARIVALSTYFHTHGITWNMQSDWVFLNNVLLQETPTLMASTNQKNILRWMHEDQGVEMDPHAHESQYLYPDVVHLMDSIGLPESKLMGGTIYNASNGMNIWTNLVQGQYGLKFPKQFWRPDYMMGGGTPNHLDDLKYFGFWNPQDPAHYLTHDTSSRLRHIGIGCPMKIETTATVAEVWASIQEVVQAVQSGAYPADGFYVQNIFFEQGDLNNLAFYNKVVQIADSVNALVAQGKAEWKTLKQAYTLWETAFAAQVFQWECGQTVASATPAEDAPRVFPNPFTHQLTLQDALGTEQFELWNALGQICWSGRQLADHDFSDLPGGMYFLKVWDGTKHRVGLVKKQ